uniref:Uncharacterized protein n=1 Tax=Anopheles atroparvus TaxID=41427 RepID=A0AAG5D023_ANOAO
MENKHRTQFALLLQRNKTGAMGSTDTGTTVLDRLVGHGELAQVVTDHVGSDFRLVERLAIVDTNGGTDHLRNDDHVTQMGLHTGRLLVRGRVLLRQSQLLDQCLGLPALAALEAPLSTAVHQLHQCLLLHVQQLIQIHTTIGEFTEGTLLLGSIFGRLVGHGGVWIGQKIRNSKII